MPINDKRLQLATESFLAFREKEREELCGESPAMKGIRPMTTEEKIEVMQAWVDGQPIQVSERAGIWDDCKPVWNWTLYDYRITPTHPPLPAGKRYVPKAERMGAAPEGLMHWGGRVANWTTTGNDEYSWRFPHYCCDNQFEIAPDHPPLPEGKRYIPLDERHGPAPKGLVWWSFDQKDWCDSIVEKTPPYRQDWPAAHYCADIDQDEWKVCEKCGNTLAEGVECCEGDVERCEVTIYDYQLVYTRCGRNLLHVATSDPDFIAYEYSVGGKPVNRVSPRLGEPLVRDEIAAAPVAVLFRRSK